MLYKKNSSNFGGIFNWEEKKKQLHDLSLEIENPEHWSDPNVIHRLQKEKKLIETDVIVIEDLEKNLNNTADLLRLILEEKEWSLLKEMALELASCEQLYHQIEMRRMFTNPMDSSNCFLEIQAGAGGTEAKDWAGMLLRMYLRYAERKHFSATLLEESEGEVAGITGATLSISGPYAYGWLRTETGIHRLVRKSPFDSNAKRHTSFASVFVYPEVEEAIDITIDMSEVRVDTYRASGAGGQHVNRTESAVRLTHLPTNIVVQCQSDRSQHRNKDQAIRMLKSRLYDYEMRKKQEEKNRIENSKSSIAWGHQIRSYVLDQSRIKDLRTQIEIGNTQSVLDGHLDPFIEESLKRGI